MFSYLSKQAGAAAAVRERDAFLKKYKAKLFEAYGIVQAEYVEVPDSLLSSTRELKTYFDCKLRLCRLPQAEAGHKEEEGLTRFWVSHWFDQ